MGDIIEGVKDLVKKFAVSYRNMKQFSEYAVADDLGVYAKTEKIFKKCITGNGYIPILLSEST